VADRHVEVVVALESEDVLAGDLWSHRRRGSESATFSYRSSYVERPGAYSLDPALTLVEGQQQTRDSQAMFGAFADCAPDRWGRTLVDRAERLFARSEDRVELSIGEIDFLLGARDDMRQGALRFREPGSSTFLAPAASGVPTLVALPELLSASERAERDEEVEGDLRLLVNGGSSLGGARPKAHVIDGSGRPAIAKFPSPAVDGWDVMRWEAVALTLAAGAGIDVPDAHLIDVAGRAVLVVDRFDRSRRDATRIGYVSAMTMLEARDGEARSYLEIVDAIEAESIAATVDLSELWRRIAFSILISNTDDHLRNHGFLRRSSAGWSLAPAFDLNPNPSPGPAELRTAIDYENREASIETLMAVAPEFRLDSTSARVILAEVLEATSSWRDLASRNGLGPSAQDRMAPAFERRREEALAAAT
jgi:serine/threonine-protein kinase HipA